MSWSATHEVGLGEAGEEPVLEHRPGAADRLLGGLADEDEGAAPAAFRRAISAAVPTRAVMWTSWPQACMTGTSVPASSLTRTVLA